MKISLLLEKLEAFIKGFSIPEEAQMRNPVFPGENSERFVGYELREYCSLQGM